jgi:hypothetical protein
LLVAYQGTKFIRHLAVSSLVTKYGSVVFTECG